MISPTARPIVTGFTSGSFESLPGVNPHPHFNHPIEPSFNLQWSPSLLSWILPCPHSWILNSCCPWHPSMRKAVITISTGSFSKRYELFIVNGASNGRRNVAQSSRSLRIFKRAEPHRYLPPSAPWASRLLISRMSARLFSSIRLPPASSALLIKELHGRQRVLPLGRSLKALFLFL